jgi:putative transposase
MPRTARAAAGNVVYHVLNRGNGRMRIFRKPGDYQSFLALLSEAKDKAAVELFGFCLMPNHWHLVLWPRRDGELSDFIRWVTMTHSQRWHAQRNSAGSGHVYQGRFKSFPIEKDDHLLSVLRYVERNGLRAKKVSRAQDWRWGSLWVRKNKDAGLGELLSAWPLPTPADWVERVNRPQSRDDLAALELSLKRSSPFGSPEWVKRTAQKLDLQWTLRPRGRPRIHEAKKKP